MAGVHQAPASFVPSEPLVPNDPYPSPIVSFMIMNDGQLPTGEQLRILQEEGDRNNDDEIRKLEFQLEIKAIDLKIAVVNNLGMLVASNDKSSRMAIQSRCKISWKTVDACLKISRKTVDACRSHTCI